MINLLLLDSAGCFVLLNFISFLGKISNAKNIYAERCEIKIKVMNVHVTFCGTETDHKSDSPDASFPAISS